MNLLGAVTQLDGMHVVSRGSVFPRPEVVGSVAAAAVARRSPVPARFHSLQPGCCRLSVTPSSGGDALLFVHLSDIHFDHRHVFDPDRGVRDALLEDLDRQVQALGPASAVLVSGDIAYGGKAADYELAAKWLEEVCGAAGCAPRSVMVCPGNHDVNQDVADGELVGGLRALIRSAEPLNVADEAARWSRHDKILGRVIADTSSAVQIGGPFVEYNDFAARFGCGCDPSAKQLFWEKSFLLGQLTVRVRGLNSALLSSRGDDRQNLYVGCHATDFEREPDVLRIVMCHHPENWLMDGRSVRDRLDEACQIQLFGHEHDARLLATDRFVRIFAGALQPDRSGSPWCPAYNLIRVEEIDGGERPMVRVEVHARDWQSRPAQFAPHHFEDGEPVRVSRVVLPHRRRPRVWPPGPLVQPALPEAPAMDAIADSAPPSMDTGERTEAVPMPEEDYQAVLSPELSWRFFRLPPHRRRAMIKKLHLESPSDKGLPDFAKMEHSLKRAQSTGRIPELMAELATAEEQLDTAGKVA